MPTTLARPRITIWTAKVLALLLAAPARGLAGSDIINSTKIFSGTLYPILYRLEATGWVKAEWENVDPSEIGRPRRRFYVLTKVGRHEGTKIIRELKAL